MSDKRRARQRAAIPRAQMGTKRARERYGCTECLGRQRGQTPFFELCALVGACTRCFAASSFPDSPQGSPFSPDSRALPSVVHFSHVVSRLQTSERPFLERSGRAAGLNALRHSLGPEQGSESGSRALLRSWARICVPVSAASPRCGASLRVSPRTTEGCPAVYVMAVIATPNELVVRWVELRPSDLKMTLSRCSVVCWLRSVPLDPTR